MLSLNQKDFKMIFKKLCNNSHILELLLDQVVFLIIKQSFFKGTEDIIRIYSEAPSLEDAKKLATIIGDLLSNNK